MGIRKRGIGSLVITCAIYSLILYMFVIPFLKNAFFHGDFSIIEDLRDEIVGDFKFIGIFIQAVQQGIENGHFNFQIVKQQWTLTAQSKDLFIELIEFLTLATVSGFIRSILQMFTSRKGWDDISFLFEIFYPIRLFLSFSIYLLESLIALLPALLFIKLRFLKFFNLNPEAISTNHYILYCILLIITSIVTSYIFYKLNKNELFKLLIQIPITLISISIIFLVLTYLYKIAEYIALLVVLAPFILFVYAFTRFFRKR
ncbi:hypothetical protein JK636_07295 [Clostridium sp. YIM B02515]|uniref:Uncharacterized protein n=1 Tax=Clostridium rhizosphaerae TaxID=2803861 RepID=A0ABS1T883_9CLOT|nr:hypothetical protein [Clostridium rhizosphaerae]MBL4935563.1 hypothetical protein [Clostridium rhizosphaerae]